MNISIKLANKRGEFVFMDHPYISGQGDLLKVDKFIKKIPKAMGSYSYLIPDYPNYKVLKFDMNNGRGGETTIDDIMKGAETPELKKYMEAVEELFEVDLTSRRRFRDVSIPRYWFYMLCYTHTEVSLHDIGCFVGKFNHASVYHGVKSVREWIETKDQKATEQMNLIANKLEIEDFRDIILKTKKGRYERK